MWLIGQLQVSMGILHNFCDTESVVMCYNVDIKLLLSPTDTLLSCFSFFSMSVGALRQAAGPASVGWAWFYRSPRCTPPLPGSRRALSRRRAQVSPRGAQLGRGPDVRWAQCLAELVPVDIPPLECSVAAFWRNNPDPPNSQVSPHLSGV